MDHHILQTTTRQQSDSLYKTSRMFSVVRTMFADHETPLGVYRKLTQNTAGSFLFESAQTDGRWARFSFIGVSSYGLLTEKDNKAHWIGYGMSRKQAFGHEDVLDPLEAVDALYTRWGASDCEVLSPLSAGLVGYIGWESVRQLECLVDPPHQDIPMPSQCLSLCSQLVVFDHRNSTLTCIVNLVSEEYSNAEEAWNEAQQQLDALCAAINTPLNVPMRDIVSDEYSLSSHASKEYFCSRVQDARKRIERGDIFQVVLSQRFETECIVEPVDVYRMLRAFNPSPYMYVLTFEDPEGIPYALVGSSPETLMALRDRTVTTHPIAGSRPRGMTTNQDLEHERDLLNDPKEKAEHIMLVDLARNDLNKVCDPGSVEVKTFMEIKRFSQVMHLTSVVEGSLRSGLTPIDVFRAVFPAGTLSGAPKPMALSIIDEYELAQRGVYGGAIGYIDFHAGADFAIAIRTAVLREQKAYFQAGAGIVADSDPELEYEESCVKASAVLKAIVRAHAWKEQS